jgi:hypothetical protein
LNRGKLHAEKIKTSTAAMKTTMKIIRERFILFPFLLHTDRFHVDQAVIHRTES